MLKLLLGKFRTGIAQDQFHFPGICSRLSVSFPGGEYTCWHWKTGYGQSRGNKTLPFLRTLVLLILEQLQVTALGGYRCAQVMGHALDDLDFFPAPACIPGQADYGGWPTWVCSATKLGDFIMAPHADLYIGAFANLPRLLDDLLQVMPFVAEQAEKGS